MGLCYSTNKSSQISLYNNLSSYKQQSQKIISIFKNLNNQNLESILENDPYIILNRSAILVNHDLFYNKTLNFTFCYSEHPEYIDPDFMTMFVNENGIIYKIIWKQLQYNI